MPGGKPAGFPDLSNMPAGLDQLPPGLEGIDVSQFQPKKKK
jgi:signal recognition particle subunit SRP54